MPRGLYCVTMHTQGPASVVSNVPPWSLYSPSPEVSGSGNHGDSVKAWTVGGVAALGGIHTSNYKNLSRSMHFFTGSVTVLTDVKEMRHEPATWSRCSNQNVSGAILSLIDIFLVVFFFFALRFPKIHQTVQAVVWHLTWLSSLSLAGSQTVGGSLLFSPATVCDCVAFLTTRGCLFCVLIWEQVSEVFLAELKLNLSWTGFLSTRCSRVKKDRRGIAHSRENVHTENDNQNIYCWDKDLSIHTDEWRRNVYSGSPAVSAA